MGEKASVGAAWLAAYTEPAMFSVNLMILHFLPILYIGNFWRVETLRIHGLSPLIFKPIVEEISASKKDEFAAKMKKALESEKAAALRGIDQYAQSFQHGQHHSRENAQNQSPASPTDEHAIDEKVDINNSTVKKINVLI